MNPTIHKTAVVPPLTADWQAEVWNSAEVIDIACHRPESENHQPRVQLRLLYDSLAIYGIYRVEDRYVRAVNTGFQAPVCRDSCVEFFFKPDVGPGYFNFEFSCGGSLLCSYIRDCTRIGEAGFADFELLGNEAAEMVRVKSSLPEVVEPEIVEPTVWTLEFAIPLALLETYAGALGDLDGRDWTANFYKCGDETSHPHWLSWAPVSELNFHLPQCFKTIRFA